MCISNTRVFGLTLGLENEKIYSYISVQHKHKEELDGRAVSALGVQSRKLSTGLNGQS
jgi:hypothetical protein